MEINMKILLLISFICFSSVKCFPSYDTVGGALHANSSTPEPDVDDDDSTPLPGGHVESGSGAAKPTTPHAKDVGTTPETSGTPSGDDDDGTSPNPNDLPGGNIDSGITHLPAGGKPAPVHATPTPAEPEKPDSSEEIGTKTESEGEVDENGEEIEPESDDEVFIQVKCFKDKGRKPGAEPTGEILSVAGTDIKINGEWLKYSCTLGPLHAFNVTSEAHTQVTTFCQNNGFDLAMPVANGTAISAWSPFLVDDNIQEYFRETKTGKVETYDRTVDVVAAEC